MSEVRIKVKKNLDGTYVSGAFVGKKNIVSKRYYRKQDAIKRAKAIAKLVGIPYDPEIIISNV